MPELPEVETIRRGLEGPLLGKHLTSLQVRTPKVFEGDPHQVEGEAVTAIDRFGKLLVLRLTGEYVLTIHLKMTGQLIWKPADSSKEVDEEADNATLPLEQDDLEEDEIVVGGHPEQAYLQPLPHKHTHIIITFDDGSHLYFNDLRKFGRMTVVAAAELPELAFLQRLGPEALGPEFTVDYLQERIAKRPRLPIKTFLLDQTNLAGLGNIYADESLFRAAILPDRLTGSLTPGEICNLQAAIQETLELAIHYGGSSSRDYLNAVGERGTFLKVANVYHRQGQHCNRCNEGTITRIKLGGRSTHFCPVCQR